MIGTIFILLSSLVLGEEILKINPYNAEDISNRIYQKISVDFDHTYNEWYISTNYTPFTITFEHKNLFYILDMDISIDDREL